MRLGLETACIISTDSPTEAGNDLQKPPDNPKRLVRESYQVPLELAEDAAHLRKEKRNPGSVNESDKKKIPIPNKERTRPECDGRGLYDHK